MSKSTRRVFLSTAAAAPVVGVMAAGASESLAQGSHQRKVIAGRPDAPFSRATVFGPFVFVSGVLGTKRDTREIPTGGFEVECIQVLENLKASIEAAGAKTADVMKCTCFLTDVADFPAFNKVFRSYFPTNPPARSTVVVKELVLSGAKIEIDCVAVLPS